MRANRLCRAAEMFGTPRQTESRRQRMQENEPITVQVQDDMVIVAIGKQGIWDGSDLSRLRQALLSQVDGEKCHTIGLDMTYVKHLGTGFFGQLCHWHEKGFAIRLYSPQSCVRQMHWFRMFFELLSDDCFVLLSESKQSVARSTFPEWSRE